jgi:hypothetical protein
MGGAKKGVGGVAANGNHAVAASCIALEVGSRAIAAGGYDTTPADIVAADDSDAFAAGGDQTTPTPGLTKAPNGLDADTARAVTTAAAGPAKSIHADAPSTQSALAIATERSHSIATALDTLADTADGSNAWAAGFSAAAKRANTITTGASIAPAAKRSDAITTLAAEIVAASGIDAFAT